MILCSNSQCCQWKPGWKAVDSHSVWLRVGVLPAYLITARDGRERGGAPGGGDSSTLALCLDLHLRTVSSWKVTMATSPFPSRQPQKERTRDGGRGGERVEDAIFRTDVFIPLSSCLTHSYQAEGFSIRCVYTAAWLQTCRCHALLFSNLVTFDKPICLVTNLWRLVPPP